MIKVCYTAYRRIKNKAALCFFSKAWTLITIVGSKTVIYVLFFYVKTRYWLGNARTIDKFIEKSGNYNVRQCAIISASILIDNIKIRWDGYINRYDIAEMFINHN